MLMFHEITEGHVMREEGFFAQRIFILHFPPRSRFLLLLPRAKMKIKRRSISPSSPPSSGVLETQVLEWCEFSRRWNQSLALSWANLSKV